ncbi:MAG: hypothetical protein WEB30_17325 [Cyclobacteriaceae bacterium]
MMDREEKVFHDDDLYSIMKKGKRTMPFDDFEDKVMDKIYYEYAHKRVVSNKLKLSLIFFIIGTVSGIVLALLFSTFGDPVFGMHPKTLTLLILFIIAVVAIMSLDNFLRLIKKYSD